MKYLFIEKNRSEFTVKKMCQTLDISTSNYQYWKIRPTSARSIRKKQLQERIYKLYSEHNGMAGSPMITVDLREGSEFSNVSPNTVDIFMREMGLKSKTVKKFVVTTDSNHNEPVAPNLLNRNFNVQAPDVEKVTAGIMRLRNPYFIPLKRS